MYFQARIEEFDPQLVRDVCAAYRRGQIAGEWEHDCFQAAMDVYMAAHPELPNDFDSRCDASPAVARMIYWAARNHNAWLFGKGPSIPMAG